MEEFLKDVRHMVFIFNMKTNLISKVINIDYKRIELNELETRLNLIKFKTQNEY